MTKWIAAFAAVTLVATPAVAQASRTGAPVDEAEAFDGGSAVPWILALVMAVGAALILLDDNDDNAPVSP
jgi:hypothetical protein